MKKGYNGNNDSNWDTSEAKKEEESQSMVNKDSTYKLVDYMARLMEQMTTTMVYGKDANNYNCKCRAKS